MIGQRSRFNNYFCNTAWTRHSKRNIATQNTLSTNLNNKCWWNAWFFACTKGCFSSLAHANRRIPQRLTRYMDLLWCNKHSSICCIVTIQFFDQLHRANHYAVTNVTEILAATTGHWERSRATLLPVYIYVPLTTFHICRSCYTKQQNNGKQEDHDHVQACGTSQCRNSSRSRSLNLSHTQNKQNRQILFIEMGPLWLCLTCNFVYRH